MTREKAIMEIKEMVDYWREEYPEAKDEIEALDMAIESLENKQAVWDYGVTLKTCTRCLCNVPIDAEYKYCPYCGAKMEVEDDH